MTSSLFAAEEPSCGTSSKESLLSVDILYAVNGGRLCLNQFENWRTVQRSSNRSVSDCVF